MNALRKIFGRNASKLTGIRYIKATKSLRVKVVLVGNSGVGKSNLAWTCDHRTPWMGSGSPEARYEHLGAEADTAHGKADLFLWDTATHDDYERLRPLFYPDTGIMVFVFAIDDPDSLDSIEKKWLPEVDHFCPGIPKVVVGCKSDLRSQSGAPSLVDTQAGVDLARGLGAWHYIECSPTKYIGIEKLLECIGTLAWELYNHSKSDDRSKPLRHELSIALPEENAAPAAGVAKA